MKEILSSQFDAVSGGWQDRDGSGQRSSNNNGSAGSSNSGGNSGDRSAQSFASVNSPYGSGSGASGFWGNGSNNIGSGYSGNGTEPGERGGRH